MDKCVSQEHIDFLNVLKREVRLIKMTQILIFIGFFGIWEIAAGLNIINPFIFSMPSKIAIAAYEMAKSGEIWVHIGVTLGETVLSFVLSTVIGTLIAIVLWLSEFLRKTLNPYLVILNALPKTALAPIIITWVGLTVKSVIVTAILTSIIVTILTVMTGFTEVSLDKIKLAQIFGATKYQVLRMVVLPASIPTIFNALKINIGLSFIGVIVGESITAGKGLGYLNIYSQQTFKMDRVMLCVIILGILSALMYRLISILERRFINR